MQKITLGILTIMLFTLSLTCVMTYCPMAAQAAETMQDCPEGDSHHQDKDGAMLMQDCLNIDLFAQDTQGDLKPDQPSGKQPVFAWADSNVPYSLLSQNLIEIRGPPYSFDGAQNYPSVFLTTQRLRL